MRSLKEIMDDMRALCDELENNIGIRKEKKDDDVKVVNDYSGLTVTDTITLNQLAAAQPYYDNMNMQPISALTTADLSSLAKEDFRAWK